MSENRGDKRGDCPFCGEKEKTGHVVCTSEFTEHAGCVNAQVFCGNCGARGPLIDSEEYPNLLNVSEMMEEAWNQWNTTIPVRFLEKPTEHECQHICDHRCANWDNGHHAWPSPAKECQDLSCKDHEAKHGRKWTRED